MEGKCFDVIDYDYYDIVDILKDPDNLVFAVHSKGSSINDPPKIKTCLSFSSSINYYLTDPSNWFYRCDSRRYQDYLNDIENRYVKVPLGDINIFVRYVTLLGIYISREQVWEFYYDKTIDRSISHEAISKTNFVSAYHCQDGSSIDVYEIMNLDNPVIDRSIDFFINYINNIPKYTSIEYTPPREFINVRSPMRPISPLRLDFNTDDEETEEFSDEEIGYELPVRSPRQLPVPSRISPGFIERGLQLAEEIERSPSPTLPSFEFGVGPYVRTPPRGLPRRGRSPPRAPARIGAIDFDVEIITIDRSRSPIARSLSPRGRSSARQRLFEEDEY